MQSFKTKFKIGDKVIVCGNLKTTITKIKNNIYYFLDENNKEWSESDYAIQPQ